MLPLPFIRATVSLLLAALLCPLSAVAATITVNETGDSAAICSTTCSLRGAINTANGSGGPHLIRFGIPGSGLHTIVLGSDLPTILETVVIDGTTESDYAGTPLIQLDGQASVSNGLLISSSAPDSAVRGLIIKGFTSAGINTAADRTTIASNYIGTDSAGTSDTYLFDSATGISISSANNIIGGDDSTARNVISANGGTAIIIAGPSASGNTIKGNFIGVSAGGDAPLRNGSLAIAISSSDSTTIGGAGGVLNGAGNVILGPASAFAAIQLTEASLTSIIGNHIGVDVNGTTALATGGVGILLVDSTNNDIGAPAGPANTIGGHEVGIKLLGGLNPGESTTLNRVGSNYIGTNSSGSTGLGNQTGIMIDANLNDETPVNDVTQNTIGGTGRGNTISGNLVGIRIGGPAAYNNVIESNLIGVAPDGSTPLGNSGDGIMIDADAHDNRIGGESGGGNTLAFNGRNGITISGGTANRITRNSIVDNVAIGIDLVPTSSSLLGVTPNDLDDSDSGPNNLQNFPEFSLTTKGTTQVQARGTLRGAKATLYTIEFFTNGGTDDTGFGEGGSYLDSTTVLTDASGAASFTYDLTVSLKAGETISATATDSIVPGNSGNTSEFSVAVRPTADLNPGGRVTTPPAVSVVEDDVTIVVQEFRIPKKKKKKRSIGITAARGSPRQRVEYQVSVFPEGGGNVQRQLGKRNTFTFNNLPPGNYTTSYIARIVEGKKVVSKTRKSPATAFAIAQP